MRGQQQEPHFVRHLLGSTVAAIALLAISPLLALIAASIFLETGLPILFSQDRIGRNGRTFRLLKFRSMRSAMTGPSVTASGDHRITRVGRFVRKFKLDELPQLWNVVRGEMNFVGPRPEVPEFVDLNKSEWRRVLQVRPGITDPASIAFRHEEQFLADAHDPVRYYQETLLPAKLAMNVAYLQERTFWGDVKVILRTARCAALPGYLDPKTSSLFGNNTK